MSSLNGFVVTEEQKKQYQEKGFFILEKVIPEEELEMVRDDCSELIRLQDNETDELGVDTLRLSRKNSRYFVFLAYKERPQLGKFLFSDRMAETCKATIGDNAYLSWE